MPQVGVKGDCSHMTEQEKPTFSSAQNEPLFPYGSLQYCIVELKRKIKKLPETIQDIAVTEFPLSVRLENIFKREKIKTLKEFCDHSEKKISAWSGLGKTSINQLRDTLGNIDIAKLAEKFSFLNPDSLASENSAQNEGDAEAATKPPAVYYNPFPRDSIRYHLADLKSIIVTMPETLRNASVKEFEMTVRLENVFQQNNIRTLNDLLSRTEVEISNWSNLGRKSVSQFCDMLRKADFADLERRVLSVAAYQQGNLSAVIANDDLTLKQSFVKSLGKVQHAKYKTILEERLGANGAPKTLDETGLKLGVTRERIRQLQKKVISQIIKGESWDDLLQLKIETLMKHAKTALYVDEFHKLDKWFCGFEDNPTLLLKILDLFSHLTINSFEIGGRYIISNISLEDWSDIRQNLLDTFEYSIGLDYTLEDTEMLVEKELSNHKAKELSSLMFDTIYRDLIFSNINGDLILTGVGSSKAQFLRAILEESDIPLHYEEITKLYIKKYGVEIKPRNVHGGLNYAQFLIFERGIYGLNKHLQISPDIRKDILTAAEETILSFKRKQWHTTEVLHQISIRCPTLVSEHLTKYTLNLILNDSKQVQYLGKMVWTGGASPDQETERLHIKKVVADILRHGGRPMRVEEIQEEMSKIRSVSRDLYMCLQPNALFSRVDPETWGLLDRDFILTHEQWSEIKNSLYKTLLDRGVAYHTTELMNAIQDERLPASLTHLHVLGVLQCDARFKIWRGGLVGLEAWKSPNRITMTEAILQVCKEAGDVLKTEEIVAKTFSLLGRDFDRNTIGLHMNRNGFLFDREKNIWMRS
jgi:hypothetical protein